MNKRTKIAIGVLVIALISALAVYNYVFNTAHRDIASEAATASISAKNIRNQFEANEGLATTTFLDKVVEVKGEITDLEGLDITLSNGVQATLSAKDTLKLKKGSTITIKGRCVGYDELLEVVKIDQSTLIKN